MGGVLATCLHCNDGEGSPLAYPCPTVAAIRTALGEGSSEPTRCR